MPDDAYDPDDPDGPFGPDDPDGPHELTPYDWILSARPPFDVTYVGRATPGGGAAGLRDVLEAQLAATDLAAEPPGCTGDRGWLLRQGVADVLQPFVTHLPRDDHDLVRYAGLTAQAAAVLLRTLTTAQLADRQNDAPTLGTVLRAAAAHPDDVEVHGYAVGPARPDERLTAEGVDVYGLPPLDIRPDHGEGCQCADLWALVTERLGVDDALTGPHEVTLRVNPWRPNEPCWRLWWD